MSNKSFLDNINFEIDPVEGLIAAAVIGGGILLFSAYVKQRGVKGTVRDVETTASDVVEDISLGIKFYKGVIYRGLITGVPEGLWSVLTALFTNYDYNELYGQRYGESIVYNVVYAFKSDLYLDSSDTIYNISTDLMLSERFNLHDMNESNFGWFIHLGFFYYNFKDKYYKPNIRENKNESMEGKMSIKFNTIQNYLKKRNSEDKTFWLEVLQSTVIINPKNEKIEPDKNYLSIFKLRTYMYEYSGDKNLYSYLTDRDLINYKKKLQLLKNDNTLAITEVIEIVKKLEYDSNLIGIAMKDEILEKIVLIRSFLNDKSINDKLINSKNFFKQLIELVVETNKKLKDKYTTNEMFTILGYY